MSEKICYYIGVLFIERYWGGTERDLFSEQIKTAGKHRAVTQGKVIQIQQPHVPQALFSSLVCYGHATAIPAPGSWRKPAQNIGPTCRALLFLPVIRPLSNQPGHLRKPRSTNIYAQLTTGHVGSSDHWLSMFLHLFGLF